MGEIASPTIRYREHNRSCGDEIEVFLEIEETTLKKWSYTAQASMITIACSGLFWDIVQWIDFETLFSWNQATIIRDTGITVSPRRHRAQILSLLATRNAIHEYLKDGKRDDFSDVM